MSFTFNGVNCETLGVVVEHYPVRVAAKRRRKYITIPGRSGDLTETEDAYENVPQEYQVYLRAGVSYPETCRKIAEWLLFPTSYAVLQDTYNTGYYRLALFDGPLNIEDQLHKFGRATIRFNCKPQLLKDTYLRKIFRGDTGVEMSDILYNSLPEPYRTGGVYVTQVYGECSLTNPLNRETKPRILVSGSVSSGTIEIAGQVLTVTDLPESTLTMIDCEAENIIAGLANETPHNGQSLFSFQAWPTLPTGAFTMDVSQGLSMIIDPMWWTV